MKTISLKKVSAVAVAALAFGGLTSVAPAQAAGGATVFESVGTNSTNTGSAAAPIPAGTAATFNLMIKSTNAVTVVGETVGAKFTVTAGPAAKDITSTCTFAAVNVADGDGVGDGNMTSSVQAAATGEFRVVVTAVAAGAVSNAKIGTASCPTTIGGTYNVTVTESTLTTASGLSFGTPTAPAAVATGSVIVSGLNVSQGTTRSTTAGTAPTNGDAAVIFTHPTRATNTATAYYLTSSGVGSIRATASAANTTATPTGGVTGNFSAGVTSTTAADNTLSALTLNLTSAVAGVQTITVATSDATTGVRTTLYTASVTWGAAPAASATYSLVTLLAGATNTAATGAAADTTSTSVSKALATQAFTIPVIVKDQNNVALTGQGLSVSITGPGTLGLLDNANNATAKGGRALSITTMAGSNASVAVWADGTAGTATITISSGTTVLAVKTVTFYGSVTKLTATQNLTTAVASAAGAKLGYDGTANSTTNVPAVIISATDKDGFAVPGLAASITGVSSDTTVIGNGTVTEDATGTLALSGAGVYNAAVTSAVNGTSGKSATMTYRIIDPAGDGTTYITSNPVTFKLGKAVVAKATWTFDKASYTAGAPMVLTLTATDSAGNPVADGLYTGLWTAAPVTSAVISSAPTADPVFTGGVKTYKTYAPSVGGPVTVTSTFGVAANTAVAASGTTVTGTTNVADGNAALITQIDALNAKIVALNALIAKIMKKLGVK